MPSEETQINLGEEPRTKIFDSFRVRGGGGRKKSANPHQQGGVTFAKVFANDLAAAEIDKENPSFPVGSVIVREKLLQATDTTPEVIAVMVKRAKGFSPRTNDWEFFTFGGADLRLQKRETKGDCAKCHTQAGKSDWIFRTYLK